jgi:RNA polymerase sigma factor (TIGR02999 family)
MASQGMANQHSSDLTTILQELRGGDAAAQGRLLQLVYEELRRMAAGFLRGEPPAHTWQATDLTHEAISRLLGADFLGQARNRAHFFTVAARTMSQLLVEHARLRKTRKRGGNWRRVRLDDVVDYFDRQALDVAAVHEALERLAAFHERQSQVVTLRFFYGFTFAEIAAQLGVSLSTVESDFRIARAWLHNQLA